MTEATDQLQHEIDLKLASDAALKLLYFSDREQRWIFTYHYVGVGQSLAEVVNEVKLVANYEAGLLTSQIVLSMHIVIPERLGREFFVGVDISPGAKTYLEFTYQAPISYLDNRVGDAFHLVEICKGARERVHLDKTPDFALVRPIEFPFPVPDQISIEHGRLRLPFRTSQNHIAHFELPTGTLR